MAAQDEDYPNLASPDLASPSGEVRPMLAATMAAQDEDYPNLASPDLASPSGEVRPMLAVAAGAAAVAHHCCRAIW
jgi:hypothetical protein